MHSATGKKRLKSSPVSFYLYPCFVSLGLNRSNKKYVRINPRYRVHTINYGEFVKLSYSPAKHFLFVMVIKYYVQSLGRRP